MSIDLQSVVGLLQTNWGWAAGLAGAMLALTLLAGKLLNPARKDEIALWLMGAQSEESWSRSFCSLFDAVFGKRHLSWKCLWRSAVASLLAVLLIWLLMGQAALGLRIQTDVSLGAVIAAALAVNLLADYVSLLETRFLLGRMPRPVVAQIVVLLFDLAVSAAIIWAAIWLYRNSPLHVGEADSFAEVLGAFSFFSVLFYSTFLTSVWVWGYILSTWVLKLFTHLRLSFLLDVENKPVQMLGYVMALFIFAGALAVSIPLRKQAGDLTAIDRFLCDTFKGRICMKAANLTGEQEHKLSLIIGACEGGVTEECFKRGLESYELEPKQAASLWDAGCQGGNAKSCVNLGFLHENGLGVDADPAAAARLYRQGCDNGIAGGCTGLGLLHQQGLGMDVDPVAAAQLYQKGCDGGHALGCTNLGFLHENGFGVDADPTVAVRLYRRGCDGGNALGCNNLGGLYESGIVGKADPKAAARFYRKGCDGGDVIGCTNLGVLYSVGHGVETDPVAAAQLFWQSCNGGEAFGCHNLGVAHERGAGVEMNTEMAGEFYKRSCNLGYKSACKRLEALGSE